MLKIPSVKLLPKIKKLEALASRHDLESITKLAELYSDGRLVRRNNRKTLALLVLGASLNDRYLTWCLADAYYHGVGVETSQVKGMQYYKLAAKLGVASAITAMGFHYFEKGDDHSRRRALALYKKAAKLNDADAIHNLGVCYSTGVGQKKNLKKAFEFFQRAALLGHIEAQFKTGWCMLEGDGVEKNNSEARKWIRKAANKGHVNAKRYLKVWKK